MTGEPRWSPEALYAHFDDKIESLGEEINRRFQSLRAEMNTRGQEARTAVEKAEAAATALAHTHNDLIRKGERDAANYATKDDLAHVLGAIAKLQSFQSKILGALALASVVVPIVTGTVVYLLTKGG